MFSTIDRVETVYPSVEDLLSLEFKKRYKVSSISARGNEIVVALDESKIIPNDLNAE